MFPGRYSEIFGLGERLGYILNLGHSLDAIEAYLLNSLVCLYTLACWAIICTSAALLRSYSAVRVCSSAVSSIEVVSF